MRYHYTSIKMTKILKNSDEEEQDHLHIIGGNIKWYSHSRKQFCSFLKKLIMRLLYDSAIALLGIYSREIKTCSHKYYAQIFIVAFSLERNTWSSYVPFKAWMVEQRWHIHAMEYYSEMKKSELFTYITPRMNDQRIILSEKQPSLMFGFWPSTEGTL